MKKLLSLLLVIAMLMGVMALYGCQKGDLVPGGNQETEPVQTEPVDLHALVSEATEKTADATCFSARMNLDMKIDVMGTKMDSISEFIVQANMTDPEKPIIGMNGTISLMDEQMPYGCYFDGQWMYVAMNGEGYKMKASLEDFKSEAVGTDNLLVDLPKEVFDGITATTEGGVTRVELTAESETFQKMYDEMLAEILSDVAGDDTGAIVVDDAKIVISVADGYLKSYDLSFKMTYTIGEEYAIYDLSMTITYDRINEEITVTPPEGYENFTDLGDG